MKLTYILDIKHHYVYVGVALIGIEVLLYSPLHWYSYGIYAL